MKSLVYATSSIIVSATPMLFPTNALNSFPVEESSSNTSHSAISTTNWGVPGSCVYRVTTIPYMHNGVVRYKDVVAKICNKCIHPRVGGQACPWETPKSNEDK